MLVASGLLCGACYGNLRTGMGRFSGYTQIIDASVFDGGSVCLHCYSSSVEQLSYCFLILCNS